MTTAHDLVKYVEALKVAGPADRPARHQAITLTWAAGRARAGLPRLIRWSEARAELVPLLGKLGRPENQPTAEYPFLALEKSKLWELPNQTAVPAAHSSEAKKWLDGNDPEGGLREDVFELVRDDASAAAAMVNALASRFFADADATPLLDMARLSRYVIDLSSDNNKVWDIPPGSVLRRRLLHDRFGGSRQSGIATVRSLQSVFLFSSSSGLTYGYNFDGPQPDGSFLYTGEGQKGDQRIIRGNKAILQPSLKLRLFREVRRGEVEYLGEFRPDSITPFDREDAPDISGDMRTVIVFRLWPTDREQLGTPPLNRELVVRVVPLEQHKAKTFISNPAKGWTEAERREAALVERYAHWLTLHGQESEGREILLPECIQPLRIDLFNRTTRELIEAKGAATRNNVRLALGQILDYSRYIQYERRAILLPVRPASDLVDLLLQHEVCCIYEADTGSFDRVDPT